MSPDGETARGAKGAGPFAFFSDRLNPILVREVNQALGGKALLWTGVIALTATVVIALYVAARGEEAAYKGARAFATALYALVPILFFVVPLQAYLSTRQEVTSGTVDHLLLSRLGPGAIVRGKLVAVTVQFVLYLAIFAPLLAMTFLLRGVDIPTIACSIVAIFVFGLAACALAVACGALSRGPVLFRVLSAVFAILGLSIFTFIAIGQIAMSTMGFGVLRLMDIWNGILVFGVPALAAIVLFMLVGRSALTHPYENRSTPFRVFAVVSLPVGFTVMAERMLAAGFPGLGPSEIPISWFLEVAAVFAAPLGVFVLFAATEETALSPRVFSRVPRRLLLAFLAIPFLPGRGRGLLFGIFLFAFALGMAPLFALLVGVKAGSRDDRELGVAVLAWLYVLFYAGLGSFVRGRLGPGERGNRIARYAVLLVLLAGILLPPMIEVIVAGHASRTWSGLDILDPIATINAHDGRPQEPDAILALVGFMTALVLVLNVPAIGRSITEVFRASGARRNRAS